MKNCYCYLGLYGGENTLYIRGFNNAIVHIYRYTIISIRIEHNKKKNDFLFVSSFDSRIIDVKIIKGEWPACFRYKKKTAWKIDRNKEEKNDIRLRQIIYCAFL